MHTGRRDTPTMLARTKGRAYEEVAASTTRTERKIMSKRERKQTIVVKDQKSQLQWENLGFKMSPAHPAGSQQRPQCCRSACAIVGLNTNGIKRACEALFRAPSDMTSLSWLF